MPDRDDYYDRQEFYRQQDRAYENFRDDLEYERRKREAEVDAGWRAFRDGDTLGAVRGIGGVEAACEYLEHLNSSGQGQSDSIYTLLQFNLHAGGLEEEPPTVFDYVSELRRRETSFLFIQPIVKNPWEATEAEVTLSIDIGLHGDLPTRTDNKFMIYPDWRTFTCWFRFGWDIPGLWTPGMYEIICLVDGVKVGGQLLTITDD